MSDNGSQSKHQLFEKKQYTRKSIRDSVKGSDAIKRGTDLYLPMPEGMALDSIAPSTVGDGEHKTPTNSSMNPSSSSSNRIDKHQLPYYHGNPAYMSYLQRARFPEITIHTLRGLVGTATRKPLEVKLPSGIAHLEEKATNDGMSIEELFGYCVSEVLQGGNIALTVDIDPDTNKPYLSTYQAETLINWRTDDDDNVLLSVLNFDEEVEGDNAFDNKIQNVSMVYRYKLSDDKNKAEVVNERYIDDELDKEFKPSLQGKKFEKLPVVYIGAIENCPIPQTSPLTGIVEISLSIYMKNADLSQAEYMTCNPNLVISGEDSQSGIPRAVGATVALILQNTGAKAYYTKTDTGALDHVQNSIDKLFEEAMFYGASLIGPDKKGVESVETTKLRQNSKGATLSGIVVNCANGVQEALAMAAKVSGGGEEKVEVIASTEFAERILSPQMLTALVNAWMASGMSLETLLRNFKEAGFLKDGDTIEDEINRIANEGPAGGDNGEEDE